MIWLEILEAAIARRGQGGQAAVARELGYSATTISLVRRGKYPGSMDRIAARVMDLLGDVACPFLGEAIAAAECRRIHSAPVPTSNPKALRHWAACLTCVHFKGARP